VRGRSNSQCISLREGLRCRGQDNKLKKKKKKRRKRKEVKRREIVAVRRDEGRYGKATLERISVGAVPARRRSRVFSSRYTHDGAFTCFQGTQLWFGRDFVAGSRPREHVQGPIESRGEERDRGNIAVDCVRACLGAAAAHTSHPSAFPPRSRCPWSVKAVDSTTPALLSDSRLPSR